MAVDLTSVTTTVSVTNPPANDPEQVRKTDEARVAQQAEQRRLEEIQADQKRADTAREERNRREQASRNATGEIIGTTVNAVA